MDGWNTNFLLKLPILRGFLLLVSGSGIDLTLFCTRKLTPMNIKPNPSKNIP